VQRCHCNQVAGGHFINHTELPADVARKETVFKGHEIGIAAFAIHTGHAERRIEITRWVVTKSNVKVQTARGKVAPARFAHRDVKYCRRLINPQLVNAILAVFSSIYGFVDVVAEIERQADVGLAKKTQSRRIAGKGA